MIGWLEKIRSLGGSGRFARPGAERSRLLKEVQRLEQEAALSTATERARLWNELGGLAGEAGESAEAQRCLGRAIDAYLEAGYYEAAAAMCRRLLRLYPDAVRARSTLAFLAIGNQDFGDARQAIADYVCATKRTATQQFGIPRLHLMAAATEDPNIKRCIGTALGELGDTSGKDAVLAGVQPPLDAQALDAGERWERLLDVAMLSRDQLPVRQGAAPAPARDPGSHEDTEAA